MMSGCPISNRASPIQPAASVALREAGLQLEQEARWNSGSLANLWERRLYIIDGASRGSDTTHGLQLANRSGQNVVEVVAIENTLAR